MNMDKTDLHRARQSGAGFWRPRLVMFAFLVMLGMTAVPHASSAPIITATKTDSLLVDNDSDGAADPGDTIRYTVQITNSGTTDATGASFNDTIDANSTLVAGSVKTTPIARNDSYSSLGNVGITVPAISGVLANDNDPDGGAVSVIAAAGGTANGGAFAIGSDGSFSYLPPTGFEGTDSFTYSVQDSDSNTDPATVFIAVSEVIWFIDNSAVSAGTGNLFAPFNSISAFNSTASDEAGDIIFLYSGSGNYNGGLTLLNNQFLFGQGATAGIAAIAGISVPPFSNTLPATGGTRPVITTTSGSGVQLAQNNTLRGLNIGSTSGKGITDNGGTVGSLTISEVAVTGPGGGFEADNGGTLAVTLDSLSANSGAHGLSLASTTGSFSVSGTGAANSGGTLSGHSAEGVLLNNTTNVSLTDMVINQSTTSSTQGIDATSVNGLTLLRTTITAGSGNSHALLGSGITNMSATNTIFDGGGGSVANFDGVRITNLLGTNSFTNSTFRNGKDINLLIENTTATNAYPGTPDTLTISGSSFSNSAGGDHLQMDANSTANLKLVVNASAAGNSTFSGTGQDGIQLEAQGSATFQSVITGATISGNLGSAVNLGAAGSGHMIARVHNLTGLTSSGTNVLNAIGFDTSHIEVTFENNTINMGGSAFNGIRVIQEDNGTVTARIASNSITGVAQERGILVQGRTGTGGNGTLNATINNNNPINISGALSLDGIEVTSGSSAGGDTNTICLNMFSNNSTSANFDGYYLLQRTGSTFRLQDFPSGTAANWVTNTKGNTGTVTTSGTFVNAPAACATPTVPVAALSASTTVVDAAEEAPEAANMSDGQLAMASVKAKDHNLGKRSNVPALSGETINIALGTLNPLQVVTITFDVTVDSPFPTNISQICNQGIVSGTDFANVLTDDPDVGGAANPTCTAVPQADLSITKSDSADPVAPSTNFVYTLSVTNNGPSSASAVAVADTLPAGASYVTDDCSLNSTPGPAVTWNIGTLANTASATCNITVTSPSSSGTITNNASVSSTTYDPNSNNNSTSEDTQVGETADLIVSKTESIDPVIAGSGTGNLTYVVTVKNDGPYATSGVTLSEVMTLPAGVSIVSVTATQGTYAPANSANGTWTVGSLAVNQSETLTIVLTVAANTAVGTDTISNTATVTASDKQLINTQDDSATESTSVAREVDLTVTKTESVDPVAAGSGTGNLTHIVTVRNNGPSDATGVTLSENITVPAGVIVESITENTGTYTPATATSGTWAVGGLAANADATLTIVYTAGSSAAAGSDVIADTAAVTGANESLINTGDDSATEATSIVARGSVTLNKVVQNDNGGTAGINSFGLSIGGTPVNSGDTLDFTPGTVVAISEQGLSGYAFVEITGAGCPSNLGGTITIQAGDNIVCTIKNDDIVPKLTVYKQVLGFGGPHDSSDFTMIVNGTEVSDPSFPGSATGTVVTMDAGSYSVSESGPDGYSASYSTNCTGSIGIGEEKSCSITNTADPARIKANKDVDPSEVWEPGGDVEYIIDVLNSGPVRPVTITDIDDSAFGNLNDECDLPVNVPAGQTFTCRFNKYISGGGGSIHYNQVTVTAEDKEGNVLTDTSDEDVHILDIASSLKVTKDADRSEVLEPGDNVLFTVTTKNTSPVDKVTIKKVIDSVFGDLTATCLAAGPKTLAVGESFTCEFSRFIGGQAGDQHSNTITVSGTDDDGVAVSDSAGEQVQVDNVPSSIIVGVTAAPQQAAEPGADVTYTVNIYNNSTADTVTIDKVEDNTYGNLSAVCLPTGPVILAPGGTHTCSFTRTVSGQAGDEITNQVYVSGRDDDGHPVADSADESVQILDTPSSIKVTKTAVPDQVTAPGGDVTFTVTILNDSPTDAVHIEHFVDTGQPQIADNCTPSMPVMLQPGQSIICTLTTYIAGQAGDVYTSRAAAAGIDDDGYPVSDLGEVTVSIVHPAGGYVIYLPSTWRK